MTYVIDDEVGLASSYHVRLRTENIDATLPEGDRVLFLDQGMRYGTYQVPVDGLFPILEFTHGFDEQFRSPEYSWGLGVDWKRGRAGEGGDGYRFPGSTLKAFFEPVFMADATEHRVRVSYQRERDQLRKPASEGSFTSLSDRVGRNLDLKYEVRVLKGVLKKAALVLGGDQWTERALLQSPRPDNTKRYDGTATLLSSFSYGPIDLDVNVLAGKGWWKDPGRGDQPDDSGETVRLTSDWLRKMDFIMAPRMGMGGTLTVRIPPREGLYLQLYAYWHHAFNVSYLPGKNREIGTVTLGYTF